MSILLHKSLGGLKEPVAAALEQQSQFRMQEVSGADMEHELLQSEVFIVGPDEQHPVKLVQEINAHDKFLSVVVLCLPAQFSKIKQQLQFSPFVGKNTTCVSYTPQLDLVQTLKTAALRTRQRRSFSRINQTVQKAAAVASTPVRIENLGIFLEQAPIGALLADEQDNIIGYNQRARRIFNIDEHRSYVVKDLLPSVSVRQMTLAVGGSSETKLVQSNELTLEINLSQVSSEEGRPVHILLINDITEQKRREAALMESEALFRFMAEAMPQKVWTADEKGELVYFNQHWLEYTGKTMEQLKGWGWLESIHPDDAATNVKAWQACINSGNNFEFEQRIRDKNGVYHWHLVRGVARKDAQGHVSMWVGTNTDIHQQKEFAEEMERRVKERTFELERSNVELEQFVYVTSHDLQEPLRKIRLYSELLKDSDEPFTPASRNHLEKVSATAHRMSTLLKELLNYTQLNRKYPFETTDLNEIVSHVLVDLELVISQKGAQIDIGRLPVLEAVPVQMQQLFYNLLNNALKFSKPGTTPVVVVAAGSAEKELVARYPGLDSAREYLHISVRDNGIGFNPGYAQQIFNIFQRLHTRHEYSGTGIGLALCKKVVLNHQGVIWAESEPGEGAVFHVLLPTTQSAID